LSGCAQDGAGRSRAPGHFAGRTMSADHARVVDRLKPDLLLAELGRSLDNLLLHKLRTLLTMLGMIFGVAAVLSMLSIGAGAQQRVMAFIEDLGVRNLIVEAREANNWQEWQKVRKNSQGLSFKELRVIRANVNGIS